MKLTVPYLRKLQSESNLSDQDISDTEVPGLILRIRKQKLSWYLRYRMHGKQTRIKLGEFAAFSLADARKSAVTEMSKIYSGVDPVVERKDNRNEKRTYADLAKVWIQNLIDTNKTEAYIRASEARLKLINKDIGKIPVTDVDASHLENLLKKYYSKPYHHNRIRAILIASFKLGMKYGYRKDTPAISLTRAPEKPRDEIISKDEFERIEKACYEVATPAAYAVLLMCYTGCRPSDAYRARWSGFDFSEYTWTREATQTKQRKTQIVELGDKALTLVRDVVPRTSSTFLFPSDSKSGHLLATRKTWSTICRIAGVRATMYTLRKYVASRLIHKGATIKQLQEIMAWENPATPLKHYVKVKKGEGRDRINDIF